MDLTGTSPKTLAVITGAYGGTGRAVARRLGARYRLVLSGRDAQRVARLRESLEEEGYDVAAAVTADIASRRGVEQLAAATAGAGVLGTLVHTAGLSPVQAPWETVVAVNLTGTALLLDAFGPRAVSGSVAVCLGSSAAQSRPGCIGSGRAPSRDEGASPGRGRPAQIRTPRADKEGAGPGRSVE